MRGFTHDTHAHTHTHTQTNKQKNTNKQTHTHTHTHAHTHAHAHAHALTHSRVVAHTRTCERTQAHTHSHPLVNSSPNCLVFSFNCTNLQVLPLHVVIFFSSRTSMESSNGAKKFVCTRRLVRTGCHV